MDCVDCHNRASHTYRSPQYEVDLALAEGRIDRTLPYIKREGMRISPGRITVARRPGWHRGCSPGVL
jgi:hypothetical protein